MLKLVFVNLAAMASIGNAPPVDPDFLQRPSIQHMWSNWSTKSPKSC